MKVIMKQGGQADTGLLPEAEHPCVRCTGRLLKGLSADCVPGNGAAYVLGDFLSIPMQGRQWPAAP